MHAVVEHIDRHLDEKLDLATLADVANFSPFHFHRLFHASWAKRWATTSGGGDWKWRRCACARSPAFGAADRARRGIRLRRSFYACFRARFSCSPTEWRKSKRGQAWQGRKAEVKRGQAATPHGRMAAPKPRRPP